MRISDWSSDVCSSDLTPGAPAAATPKFVLVQRDGSVQSAVRLGRPAIAATDPDYIALQLANAVVGGGFSSRLMQNLREDKGYTYGARSSVSALRERSEEHTSELQSLMRMSYAVFCLKQKTHKPT